MLLTMHIKNIIMFLVLITEKIILKTICLSTNINLITSQISHNDYWFYIQNS